MLKKIISGGQDGVDISALRAAKFVGLETGGAMPFSFKAISGIHPEYVSLYGMTQTGSSGYTERTKKNVKDSDGTIIITQGNSAGTQLALQAALSFDKPFALLKIGPCDAYPTLYHSLNAHTEAAVRFLSSRSTVNIAGNRDPRLELLVTDWLVRVFREVLSLQPTDGKAA